MVAQMSRASDNNPIDLWIVHAAEVAPPSLAAASQIPWKVVTVTLAVCLPVILVAVLLLACGFQPLPSSGNGNVKVVVLAPGVRVMRGHRAIWLVGAPIRGHDSDVLASSWTLLNG